MIHVLIKTIDLRITGISYISTGIDIIVKLSPVPGHIRRVLARRIFDEQR